MTDPELIDPELRADRGEISSISVLRSLTSVGDLTYAHGDRDRSRGGISCLTSLPMGELRGVAAPGEGGNSSSGIIVAPERAPAPLGA